MLTANRVVPSMVLAALVIAAPLINAQEPVPDGEAIAIAQPVATAPVTLDGVVLFSVRGVSSFPAEERATQIAGRIRRLARDPGFDPSNLTLVEEAHLTSLMAGETRVMAIVDADGHVEGVTRSEIAIVIRQQVLKAINRYRSDRQSDAVIAGGARALAATLLVTLALMVLRWLWRRFDRWLSARLERRLRSLGVESVQAGSSERVAEIAFAVLRGTRSVILLAAVFFYLHFVLGLFPWTRPLHGRLAEWVVDPLQTMGRAVVDEIPNLIFLGILFLVLRWLLGLIRLFFSAIERQSLAIQGFDPEWAQPTFKIVRLVVIAFGAVVAYPYIPGSSSAAFKGLSLFAGVVFSIGSSSVIANLIAGYTMIYRGAFKVGDRVRIGNIVGDVTAIRLQVTHIRTLKNEEAVVPNSMILGQEVINYSSVAKSSGVILHSTVGIGYETPWRQVEAMLLLAAERTPGLLAEPAPFVLQQSLGDFCITYEINVYSGRPKDMAMQYTELHRNILDVFNEYGVQIMTPSYEADPEEPKLVPRGQWHPAPAAPETD